MNIYIDESGPFSFKTSGGVAVSCVGALVVPEKNEKDVFEQFQKLKDEWCFGKNEVKGSKLNEVQFEHLIQMLAKLEVTFYSIFIDTALEDSAEVQVNQAEQVKAFRDNIPGSQHQTMKEDIEAAAKSIEDLSLPNYVQFQMMNRLLDKVLRRAELYYVQRMPEELGNFNWVVDAKDVELAPMEVIWKKALPIFLQSAAIKEPVETLEGADYSFMKKYAVTSIPDYLKGLVPAGGQPGSDSKLILQKMSFLNSEDNLGLQLVDVLVAIVRRSCVGTLKWEQIPSFGKVIIQRYTNENYAIEPITLSPNAPKPSRPYKGFLVSLSKNTKRMIV